jgi:hypothetical protein
MPLRCQNVAGALRQNEDRSSSFSHYRTTMPEYNFQLRGWHAIVGTIVLAVYLGGTILVHLRPVDDGMRDAIRDRLQNEYSGRGPKDIARIVAEAREGSPVEALPSVVQRDVELVSLAAHGKLSGRVTYVRAVVMVDGGPPPDGRSIRYFALSSKLGGGWMVVGETNSYSYYTELLP